MTFVLGVPGMDSVTKSVDVPGLLASGDSLFSGGSQRAEFLVPGKTDPKDARLIANEHGRLARIEVTFQADNFVNAEALAHDALMPLLSFFAVESDTPVEVKATIITEQSTNIVQVGAHFIGSERTTPSLEGWTTPEIRPFLATYREGLNSTSPIYRALSFYKAIEGIEAHYTSESRKANARGKIPPPDPMLREFPQHIEDLPFVTEWERAPFRRYLGKTFADVKQAAHEPVRNALSHLTPGKNILFADKLGDIEKCRAIVPVLRYVARELVLDKVHRVQTSLPAVDIPPR